MRSRWALSMLAWTLKTNPAKGASSGPWLAVHVLAGRGRRDLVDDGVEQQPDAEVGQRRTEEHRRGLTGQEQLLVVVGSLEEVELVGGGGPRVALVDRGTFGVHQLLRCLGGPPGGAGEANELVGPAIDHATEVTGDARRATSPECT